MKKAVIFILTICFYAINYAQEYYHSSQYEDNYIGNNLNLYATLDLFKHSYSIEDFENRLNSQSNNINNLDLNNDGQIDYLRVIEKRNNGYHSIIIQDLIDFNETQDIAVIGIEQFNRNKATIQIIGNEYLYGREIYAEPYSNVNISLNVWSWPIIQYIFRPTYMGWISPYRYSYYPRNWRSWRPYSYDVYVRYQNVYRPHYRYQDHCRVTNVYNYYKPNRSNSRYVETHYRNKSYQSNRTSYNTYNQTRNYISNRDFNRNETNGIGANENLRFNNNNRENISTREFNRNAVREMRNDENNRIENKSRNNQRNNRMNEDRNNQKNDISKQNSQPRNEVKISEIRNKGSYKEDRRRR